jgi:hypothetical protein
VADVGMVKLDKARQMLAEARDYAFSWRDLPHDFLGASNTSAGSRRLVLWG